MKMFEISTLFILFVVLWLVVCMPELNRAWESTTETVRIAVLH
jgi:hypothetical protein